jgi:hypothetical protein
MFYLLSGPCLNIGGSISSSSPVKQDIIIQLLYIIEMGVVKSGVNSSLLQPTNK